MTPSDARTLASRRNSVHILLAALMEAERELAQKDLEIERLRTALDAHHSVGSTLAWGEKCVICARLDV